MNDQKLKIFLSYARADMQFTDALVVALEGLGIEVTIDRRDLPYGEEWKGELLDFVRAADTIVFTVSPRSVASKWCAWEADQVKALSKRLVPIVLEDVPPAELPAAIGDIHLLPFLRAWDLKHQLPTSEFQSQCELLALVLNTDRVWLKEHTRLGSLAQRWDATGRPGAQLLRGDEIALADQWISSRPRQSPEPSQLHLAFLQASRDADLAEKAAKEEQIRQLRRATGAGFVAPALEAVRAGYYDKALRYAAVGSQLADDPTFKLVPELHRAAAWAAFHSRLRAFLDHDDGVRWATFSPDGLRILTACDDHLLRQWDVCTSSLTHTLRGHTDAVVRAEYSADGSRIVTASDDRTARLWDAATGAELAVLGPHRNWVSTATFSPDGIWVATASLDGSAHLWDAKTGRVATLLDGHHDIVGAATFSPNGDRMVTASFDKTARLWNLKTSTPYAVLEGHDKAVVAATFSPDGRLVVTASDDNTARVWSAKTGSQIAVLTGHGKAVASAVFNPAGTQVATASDDCTARIWDAKTGTEIAVLKGHQARVTNAGFSADGRLLLSASFDGTARLWDLETARVVTVLRGHTGRVKSATFRPDGRYVVTASEDQTCRLWDARIGVERPVMTGHTGRVMSAAFCPLGKWIVTASLDNTARLWDARTGVEIAVLHGHQHYVYSARFSPDGVRVVTASKDCTARVWDAEQATQIAIIKGHTGQVWAAEFSPDGTLLVTASDDRTARLWDSRTGREIRVIDGHKHAVMSAAFNPQGCHIVTASYDHTARIWDAKSTSALRVYKGHKGPVRSAAFSPDGARVVTASYDCTAHIWDASTGAEILRLCGHRMAVMAAAFNSDGSLVITASNDCTARLWDALTGAPICVIEPHVPRGVMIRGTVDSAAFSSDGSQIVTTSDDGTARLSHIRRAFAVSSINLPRVAPFLAGQKNNLGVRRRSDVNDLLLRQGEEDTYASAVRKWPDIVPHIERAQELLSEDWPAKVNDLIAGLQDDPAIPGRFGDLIIVNTPEPEQEHQTYTFDDASNMPFSEQLGESNARTFAQAHWRAWRDGRDTGDLEFEDTLAKDIETGATLSVADLSRANSEEMRGDQNMAAADFFAADYAYRKCLEIRQRLTARDSRNQEWKDDLARILLKLAYVKSARSLVESGRDLGSLENAPRGETALHVAASFGHELVIEKLLAHGAIVSALTTEHRTPLHVAIMNGHMGVARVLTEHGADGSQRDEWNMTAADLATGEQKKELFDLLTRYQKQRTSIWRKLFGH